MAEKDVAMMCHGCDFVKKGECVLSWILSRGQNDRAKAGSCEEAKVAVDGRLIKSVRVRIDGSWIWSKEAGK